MGCLFVCSKSDLGFDAVNAVLYVKQWYIESRYESIWLYLDQAVHFLSGLVLSHITLGWGGSMRLIFDFN